MDHVLHLYATSCESGRDLLEEFIERYPNYEDDLREFAAFRRIDETIPDRTYTNEEEQLLNARAISAVQNAIYESRHGGKSGRDAKASPRRKVVSKTAAVAQTQLRKPNHLCECIAQLEEIGGEYRRKAAGPLDNKLIYSVEEELKKQKWFETYELKGYGHGYRPLSKAGGHRIYFTRWWPQKGQTVVNMIELMRSWKTQRCEILSTVYAAWNDLIIWGKPITDDFIIREVLERWHEGKKSITEQRWRSAISWMREKGLMPTGFGQATANRK